MLGFPEVGYAGVGRRNGLREPMGSTSPLRLNAPIVGGGEEGGIEPWVEDGGGEKRDKECTGGGE